MAAAIERDAAPRGQEQMTGQMIQSVGDFINVVRADSSAWHPSEPVWFRGGARKWESLVAYVVP